MAKDEIDRASRAGVEEVAVATKQHDAAELLKKMKVVADADHQAPAEATQVEAPAQVAAADAQMVASADSIFASDAAAVEVAQAGSTATDAGSSGGVSTGTLLAIGGVALVGGGIAIAASSDGGGHHHKAGVSAVTPSASTVEEGNPVTFTVTGTPGQSFTWTAAIGSETYSGTVVINSDGTGTFAVTPADDHVTEASQTLTVTVGGVTTTVAVTDPVAPAAPTELTTGTDSLDFSGTSGANHVEGVSNGITIIAPGTFNSGDKVIGNGETILDLKVGVGGPQGVAQLEHLGEIDLVNAGSVLLGPVTFNASLWTDVGSINLVDGADGFQVGVTDLEVGTGLGISDLVAGTLSADYTDQTFASVSADHNSAISFGGAGGDVEANVANGETAGFDYTYEAAPALDLTVGDVTATLGNSSDFEVNITDEGGAGAVTVGDINITGGKSSSAEVTITASNTDPADKHDITVGSITAALGDDSVVDVSITNTGTSDVGDITVGAVDLAVGASGEVTFSVEATAEYDAAGDHVTVGSITVGDVSLTGGKSADLTGSISNEAYANTANGTATTGNVTVGDITLAVGDGTSASADFFVYDFAYAGGSGVGATGGDVLVGDVSLTGGKSAEVYASVENTAQASGTGGVATDGDLTVGDISMVIGQSGEIGFEVYHSAEAEASATLGDTTIGNLTLDIGTSAEATYTISVSASASGAANGSATIGNVSIGDISGALAVNADFSSEITISAEATGTGHATIGNVDVGAVDVTLNDGAFFSIEASIYASSGDVNTVGDVSFGNVSINSTNGVSSEAIIDHSVSAESGTVGNVTFGDLTTVHGAEADVTEYNYVYGATIGDVTFGDVDADASAANGYFYNYNLVSAYSGDLGNVTIGDVSVLTGKSGTGYAEYYLNATSGDIGNITVGNVSVDASGDSAYASFSLTAESTGLGGGDIGNISVGNLTLNAIGAGANAYANIDISATHDLASFSVGDISLAVNADTDVATAQTATAELYIVSNFGDITVGDVSLDLGDAKGANVGVDTNNITFSVSATGDVTLGVISVVGGDGAAGNNDYVNGASADVFTNVMSNITAGGDITIGGVDYSGYGGAATIDVSTFKGAATIVGSAFDDTITDNKGTNTITGGDGADTFNFVTANTGKTEATADKITDFLYSDDHIGTGFGAITVAQYTEGTFADFASFLSNADSADKVVAAGQVGANVFLAVDYDNSGSVDYVVELVNTNLANVAVDSFV